MVLFKEKKNKAHRVDTRVTLDAKHNSKLKGFKSGIRNVKKLKIKLGHLRHKFSKFQGRSHKTLNDDELETKLHLREVISSLENEIETLESNAQLNNYLLDTSYLLYNYYNDDLDNTQHKKKKTLIKQNLSVVDFFTRGSTKTSPVEDVACQDEQNDSSVGEDISEHGKSSIVAATSEPKKFSKNEIINSYLSLTESNYVNNIDHMNDDIDYCVECNVEKIHYQSEGVIVCPNCASIEKILLDSDKPSYKEPPREISYFAYKRINHFNEWLAQFQAKESTDIPKTVYDRIRAELKKESYLNKSQLKINKIREILNKLNLNKYYEHVPHIINRLSGTPAPIITRETEDKLRMMFKEIQAPWIRYCPNNRSNFLSYSYVLYKCLQLLEFDEYLDYFNLLKSREKLAEADKIWKLICHDLRWEFIKTI